MEFRIKTEMPDTGSKIGIGTKVFSIGSCFAENIAAKMDLSGFPVASNPFGVLYNPASIAGALEILAEGREFKARDLVRNGELWCSPLFHGSFSGTDPDLVLDRMNLAVEQGRRGLAEAGLVMVSFGTQSLYTVSAEFGSVQNALPAGGVVANCHRLPARYYDNRRMEVHEIVSLFKNLSSGILNGKKIIYTVSPVRYVKDTLHGSNLGKAVLHLAVEGICRDNPEACYFPAYEILTDELRDYRFYADDMVHPSQAAVDYIWELFREWTLTPQAAAAAVEIGKLSAGMRHRVGDPGSPGHLEYLRAMLEKTELLAKKYPGACIDKQARFFASEPERLNVEK